MLLGGAKCMQKKMEQGWTMVDDIKTKKTWRLSLGDRKWSRRKRYGGSRCEKHRWSNLYRLLALWIQVSHSPSSYLIFLCHKMQKQWKQIPFIDPWFCTSGIYNPPMICISVYPPLFWVRKLWLKCHVSFLRVHSTRQSWSCTCSTQHPRNCGPSTVLLFDQHLCHFRTWIIRPCPRPAS